MCAINPKFKRRLVFDVYDANPNQTQEGFDEQALEAALKVEQWLNANTKLRWHLKESKEQAD